MRQKKCDCVYVVALDIGIVIHILTGECFRRKPVFVLSRSVKVKAC